MATRGACYVAATAAACAAAYALYVWRRECERAATSAIENDSTGPPAKGVVAGGHDDSIRFVGDRILKKQQGGGRGERECDFLVEASKHPFLKEWAPRCMGAREVDGEKWTEMANSLHGMERPVVLDLKLGTQTWHPGASAEKRREHEAKAKSSTSGTLGVRVTGGQLRVSFGGALEPIGAKMKREVRSEAELADCLRRYLVTSELRATFLAKMTALETWFSAQTDFAFFGSSVLLAFDGAIESPVELRVTLIDFPHVHRLNRIDLSCLAGATTLRRLAQEIS